MHPGTATDNIRSIHPAISAIQLLNYGVYEWVRLPKGQESARRFRPVLNTIFTLNLVNTSSTRPDPTPGGSLLSYAMHYAGRRRRQQCVGRRVEHEINVRSGVTHALVRATVWGVRNYGFWGSFLGRGMVFIGGIRCYRIVCVLAWSRMALEKHRLETHCGKLFTH